jgi:hypothetical protein
MPPLTTAANHAADQDVPRRDRVAVVAPLRWSHHPLAAAGRPDEPPDAGPLARLVPVGHVANDSSGRRLSQSNGPGNRHSGSNVKAGMDDEERQALYAEELDPDDPGCGRRN